MKKNDKKKIPLNLNKLKNKNSAHMSEKTDTRESNQNIIINKASLNPINNKGKKKKRVSFADQVQSKKEIAQIIFINDKISLKDDKIKTNQNFFYEQYRKQCTNISELNKRDNNDDVYRIKRPKKYAYIHNPKHETVKEQCTCIIF